MLYFAYGSNMDPVQMRKRCPSARIVGVARLADHRLAFTRRSTRRRCGVADVSPQSGSEVWGVVYRITKSKDLRALDSAEGFRTDRKRSNSYARRLRQVTFDTPSAKPRRVSIYLANPHRYPPRPSIDYIGHLCRGAEYWGLPIDYQKMLTHVSTLT